MSVRSLLATPLARWPLYFFMYSIPGNSRNRCPHTQIKFSCHLPLFSPLGCFAIHSWNKDDFKTERFTHTEEYSQTKSIPPFNTVQERARYLVFAESAAEKMKTTLASHIFMMGNSYFEEAKPSIDKEQKKEARVFRLLSLALDLKMCGGRARCLVVSFHWFIHSLIQNKICPFTHGNFVICFCF